MKQGWYFFINDNDYFVISERDKKTKTFAKRILDTMFKEQIVNAQPLQGDIDLIFSRLRKATLEVKHCNFKNGKSFDYYDIYGKDFTCGKRLDENKTFVLIEERTNICLERKFK